MEEFALDRHSKGRWSRAEKGVLMELDGNRTTVKRGRIDDGQPICTLRCGKKRVADM